MAAGALAGGVSPWHILTENEPLDTFVCDICSKIFTKRASRNRHRLYCRKKSALGQPNRKKPCVGCRQAKIKCNAAFPSCGRCAEKKVACVYDRKTIKTPLVQALSGDDALEFRVSPLATLENGSWDLNTNEGSPDFSHDAEASKVTGTHDQSLVQFPPNVESSMCDVPSDDWIFEPSRSPDATNTNSTPSTESTALAGSSFTPDTSSDDLSVDFCTNVFDSSFQDNMALDLYFLNTNFPLSPSPALDTVPFESSGAFFDSPYLKLRYLTSLHHSASRSSTLTCRKSPFVQTSRNSGPQLGRGFLLQTIRCYPNMMLEGCSSPHFIHQSALARSDHTGAPTSNVLESLAVCQSIVQMHSTKIPQTSAFLWRTMASEITRLAEVYHSADQYNTLAMLQALTIYILLRISSTSTFTLDFDTSLIETMTDIAIHSEESGFLCTSEVLNQLPAWKEWILMESKRRTVMLLFIIHLLFDINPGQRAKALGGMTQLPLPAYRTIWEARTEEAWRGAYEEWLKGRDGRGALNYGDLIYLGQSGLVNVEDPRRKDLDAWYVNVDAFGMLVMMAATSLSL